MSEMYCPSCGNEVNANLSYCNQCGARLGAADARVLPASTFNMTLAGVIGLPFVGLVLLFGVIAALKNGMGFRDDFIFAITFLTFILFAIAEIGCVILLLTRTKGPKAPKKKASRFQTGQLDQAESLGLGSPTFEPTPVGSVTDHTTRTLDQALRKDRNH